MYNEKLNEEMNKSLCLEREKTHWENEYNLLAKKYEDVSIYLIILLINYYILFCLIL